MTTEPRKECALFVPWDAENLLALMEDRPDLKPGSKHYWVYAGGKVKRGESPVNAMRRECREELGVRPVEWVFLAGPEMLSEAIPGTKSMTSPSGWITLPFLVTHWNGTIPEHTLDHNHAPLSWRDPHEFAGEPDGYTCVAQVANAVIALTTSVAHMRQQQEMVRGQ